MNSHSVFLPRLLALAALSSAWLMPAFAGAAEAWTVTSPDGSIQLSVQLADLGGTGDYPPGRARLYYRIRHGVGGAWTTVVKDSPLGLRVGGQDFTDGLRLERASDVKHIEESYTIPHGKRSQCVHRANQVTLMFHNAGGQPLELDLRASDDGAAFRYRLPGSGDRQRLVLEAETTGFALPTDGRLWLHPSDKATVYSPGYETYYENGIAVGTPSPTGKGWAYPVLLQTASSGHWALITEANLGANFCGTRLASTAPHGVYRVALPDPEEGHRTGSILPSSSVPWEMPWRVVIVGNSLATVVESTLVNDLSAPSTLKNTGWIRPGRVAWSWWSDPPSSKDAAKQKRFVDLAAAMGWEYVLVDANWTIIDNGSIHDVIRHAKTKGVGILLWYNSGGPHNIVTEKPRDSLFYPEVRRFELDLLRQWGVKGIKVDFFQSDKQEVIDLYHALLRDAAEYQIMLNFHGCTLPRGWERTYPHLMSMEAVRGEECYIFDDKFPERAPVQNTITPFTRNVVGPMDYTPVGFSDNKYPHRTTAAHELALSVLFETGWLHFADKPEAYLNLPKAPKEFLRQVPVAWDDTRFVAGHPGKFVVIARRHGDTWYLAGVNGLNAPREERLRLGNWLARGDYLLTLISDGARQGTLSSQSASLSAGEDLGVKLLPYGGFVATLKPANKK